jgi:RNA polymerase sigma factor (TIGR02999 family)
MAKGGLTVSAITDLLSRWNAGDDDALARLVPLVYEDLRIVAAQALREERSGHTLQPTALVHEAYLRLRGVRSQKFRDRTHFYAAAARAMRRILVDHARRRGAVKRGQGWMRVSLDDVPALGFDLGLDLVGLDAALEDLTTVAPAAARVVELRCFAGLSVEETAAHTGASAATVKRHWAFARAWLFSRLVEDRQ